jgi:hypothetical protein
MGLFYVKGIASQLRGKGENEEKRCSLYLLTTLSSLCAKQIILLSQLRGKGENEEKRHLSLSPYNSFIS